MSHDLDAVRQSATATLSEIARRESNLLAADIDVRDEGEWLQLRDIVARIERKLAGRKAEAAE